MSAVEKHYGVPEIAEMWHLSQDLVREMFRNRPGVLKINRPAKGKKRAYCTLQIPESVMQRVHDNLTKAA